MSAASFGTRPVMADPTDQTPKGLAVASRLIHLDPGWFSLALLPGPMDRGTGLPAARVSLPPGPPERRAAVSISTFRGDGWMTIGDQPTLLRVLPGGAEILATLYWQGADLAAQPPAMQLTRLNPEGTGAGPVDSLAGSPGGGAPWQPSARPAALPLAQLAIGAAVGPTVNRGAEIVAHIEGIGDVDGRCGDWVGMRGSGRAIEGFSLTPRQGIAPEDFEIRAVLGRDWLSPWLPGGSFCGSRGLALPMRGFSLRLHAPAAARVDLACFARFVDGSEVGPVGPDRLCAAPTLAALEAFQVLLRPRVG